jgi:Holliday junction resolvase RusA-like endonuclease
MTAVFVVPDFLPTSANRLMRMHYSARNRALKGDAELVAVYALQAGVAKAVGKRRLRMTFTSNDSLPDPDNCLKSLLDSLVKARLLLDDSPSYVELAAVSVKRGERRMTTVELEDVM